MSKRSEKIEQRERERVAEEGRFRILPNPSRKEKPPINFFPFSHYEKIDKIKDANLANYSLGRAVSTGRDASIGFYLNLILTQNPELREPRDYNRAYRNAAAEQSREFMSKRNILVLNAGKNPQLEGKVDVCSNYFDFVQRDEKNYDLIIARNINSVYESLKGRCFETALRENPHIKIRTREWYKNPASTSLEDFTLEDEQITAMGENVGMMVRELNELNKKRESVIQQIMEESKEVFNNPKLSEKEKQEGHMAVQAVLFFNEVFKEQLKRAEYLEKSLAPEGLLSRLLLPRGILVYLRDARGYDDGSTNPEAIISKLGSTLHPVARQEKNGVLYLGFAKN